MFPKERDVCRVLLGQKRGDTDTKADNTGVVPTKGTCLDFVPLAPCVGKWDLAAPLPTAEYS